MMPLKERIAEVLALPSIRRIAGYLARSAKASELGATLRTKYADDSLWTTEENAEWDRLIDDMDAWHYALTDDEQGIVAGVEISVLSPLCRGEMPFAELPSSLPPPSPPMLQP